MSIEQLSPERRNQAELNRQHIVDIFAGRYIVQQTVEYVSDEYDETEGKND